MKQRLFHHFAGWLGELEDMISTQETIAALRLSLAEATKLTQAGAQAPAKACLEAKVPKEGSIEESSGMSLKYKFAEHGGASSTLEAETGRPL